ncbi:MAG: type II toxin-antitoxin system Phd/YefM family antitoxin [Sulfuricella sp.]
MRQCNLYEAKTHLSQLVQAALDGEEVLIARAGKPAVRLVPVQSTEKTGGWGVLSIDPAVLEAGFDTAVEDEVAALFQPGAGH